MKAFVLALLALFATPAAAQQVPKTKLGVNLASPTYFNGTRVFTNLAEHSPIWTIASSSSPSVSVDRARLNSEGIVTQLAEGERISRIISAPNEALQGKTVAIVCKWDGTATVSLAGRAKDVKVSANSATFNFVPSGLSGAQFLYRQPNPADPLRNLDCREPSAASYGTFHPAFLNATRRYDTIRFMKWQTAVESNVPVTWAARTKPNAGRYRFNDGVALEYMVLLANQTSANPWFSMPWNADEEYVRKFAEYVRDNLKPGLVAYVETSNEVWNWVYPVTRQAYDEGIAEGLHTNPGYGLFLRYAEKHGEQMDIWSSVFAGQTKRIVRVAATQNASSASKLILDFRDTLKKTDALATAPYFSATIPAEGDVVNVVLNTQLPDGIQRSLGVSAVLHRDLARSKGLRFITYEAGQHVNASANVAAATLIQRDRRMGQRYTTYLNRWKNEYGDLMVLFVDYGDISKYGGWGMQEYIGQPLSQAPKAQAVENFRLSISQR